MFFWRPIKGILLPYNQQPRSEKEKENRLFLGETHPCEPLAPPWAYLSRGGIRRSRSLWNSWQRTQWEIVRLNPLKVFKRFEWIRETREHSFEFLGSCMRLARSRGPYPSNTSIITLKVWLIFVRLELNPNEWHRSWRETHQDLVF